MRMPARSAMMGCRWPMLTVMGVSGTRLREGEVETASPSGEGLYQTSRHGDATRSFSLGADRGELSPKRVHVATVTDGDRVRERASVEDRVHHAGKARPVEIAKIGDEHSGLPVGEHRAM